MSPNARALVYAATRLGAALALGLLLGWILGNMTTGLGISLGGFLGWQLYHLARVDFWLRRRAYIEPPDTSGMWGDVVAQVSRLHRRKRFHKQRMLQIFRELRRATAAMPDGIVILNAAQEILWFNRAAAQLLRLERRQDIGLRIDNLIRQEQLGRYLRNGDFSSAVTVPGRGDGPQRLSIQAVPYGEEQCILLVRDVTQQLRLETMRRDFVANASHELRTPLTVIAGYLETMAADPQLPAELATPIEEMRHQAVRMTRVIEHLLELSRLETAEGPAPRTPVDVPQMLRTLIADARQRCGTTRQIELDLRSGDGLLGVEAELHSAFANIVENAIKYSRDGGRIVVSWGIDGGSAMFAVRDEGIGIAAEHLPRLTERFYRASTNGGRGRSGSGLGLAIVKHVLQRHEAELQVESVEGRGSRFACVFPPSRIGTAALRKAAS
ncbi:MAG: phosphate regulon sensor histidine kinase PhoR [Steroidobacteraceae bacterium]